LPFFHRCRRRQQPRTVAEGGNRRSGRKPSPLFPDIPEATGEDAPAMKQLFTAASLAVLMAVPAVAQDTAAPEGQAQSAPVIEIVERQKAISFSGDVSAKELLDGNVMHSANENIGDINDILIDREGKIAAVIVGVGGLLGMGEKNVALPYDQLTFGRDDNNELVIGTSATKESLQAAPEYSKREDRS
jgi:sporulation protein YlmC with PRC-barrel domain